MPNETETRSRKTWTPELEERAERFSKQGIPAKVIAENLGVSVGTLRNRLPQFFVKAKNVPLEKPEIHNGQEKTKGVSGVLDSLLSEITEAEERMREFTAMAVKEGGKADSLKNMAEEYKQLTTNN